MAAPERGEHGLGERGERDLVVNGEQRQAVPGAGVGERRGHRTDVRGPGDERRDARPRKRGDEHIGVARLVVPGGTGQDEFPAVEVAPRVGQVGGVDAPDARALDGGCHDGPQPESWHREQFG